MNAAEQQPPPVRCARRTIESIIPNSLTKTRLDYYQEGRDALYGESSVTLRMIERWGGAHRPEPP